MNSQIEAWRVQQYAGNVYQLSQQKGSRLATLVRNEEFTGKAEFFDRLGLALAQDKTGRNTDTPNLNINQDKRMVSTITREWGTLVDRKDKVQQIHNPENEYAIAAQNALGRKLDLVIIDGALTTARTGEDGSGTQTLGNAQKIACVASNALATANIGGILAMKKKLDQSEAVGPRYLIHNGNFLSKLLNVTQITSADYNTIKALVAGEIDTFLGFKWIRTELTPGSGGPGALPVTSYDADTFLFDPATGLYQGGGTALTGTEEVAIGIVGDGVLLGKNPNALARIDERSDKSYATQVYAAMDFGAVRMEEAKVVQLMYSPS